MQQESESDEDLKLDKVDTKKQQRIQQPMILQRKIQEKDLQNHNLIENKKTKVNKAMKILREMKTKPRFKDKYGNNVKEHFGIYKYFINTAN